MENKGISEKIKSSYILEQLLNYIRNMNIKLKLFKYSKYFQRKINIINLYKFKYLKKIRFNLSEYLYIEPFKYEKNILNQKYDEFILKNNLNKEKFEKRIYEILVNKKIKEIQTEYVNMKDLFVSILLFLK